MIVAVIPFHHQDTSIDSMESIALELDATHAESNLAFANRDLNGYRKFLASDLSYTQTDGTTLGVDDIMKSVAGQFTHLKACRFSYTRENLKVLSDDTVVETLSMDATVDLRHLWFLKRRWDIDRHGDYTWRRNSHGWELMSVVVDRENVTLSRSYFATAMILISIIPVLLWILFTADSNSLLLLVLVTAIGLGAVRFLRGRLLSRIDATAERGITEP